MQNSRHIVLSFDGARRESGLGPAVLRNASAMIAGREALRMGIEYLTVSFPTEVSSFDFQVECTDRTVQYKLNAQSLRLFGLHSVVLVAHRAGANGEWRGHLRQFIIQVCFSTLRSKTEGLCFL